MCELTRGALESDLMAKAQQSFAEATDHRYNCACMKCLDWWVDVGPDPGTLKHGPFSDDTVRMRAKATGRKFLEVGEQ